MRLADLDAVGRVRLPAREGVWDVALNNGRVGAIRRHDVAAPTPTRSLDGNGNLLAPGFVDAHVHLDKAFLLEPIEASAMRMSATLPSAIESVRRLGPPLATDVNKRAERALALMAAQGTVAARVHVEISESTGPDAHELHVALKERWADALELQLTAFPQLGLQSRDVRRRMREAMSNGAEVVGGCPYIDDDPKSHLDFVFELAERTGSPVDLHLDFDDDPHRSMLDLVVERTVAGGMQGKVLLGHVTTLAAMDRDVRRSALAKLADAGIGIVAAPATDLYLGGHGAPGFRSLAPLLEAHQVGVDVAIGTNNLVNPFAPFGNASLMQAGWLAGLVLRAVGPVERDTLFSALTTAPARLLGLGAHGPEEGHRADLVLLAAPSPSEGLSLAAPTVATIVRGRHRTSEGGL